MQIAAPTTSRVYIDPPVFGQINPPAPAGRKAKYEHYEISAINRELREYGYDTRAIVVRRRYYSDGSPADYEMGLPKNWGFVVELSSYQPNGQDYQPIKVNWVDGSSGAYWPEDLFLIEGTKSQAQMKYIFKRQEDDNFPI